MKLYRRSGAAGPGMLCFALVIGSAGVGTAAADLITPASYTYTNGTPAGEPGYSAYEDPNDTKLTDGVTGTPNPSDGTWVGLEYSDSGSAQVTFHFTAPVTITDVSIDFLRDDQANTQLPESVVIDNTTFPVTDFATDLTQGFVNFTGSWTGSDLVLTMDHTVEHWIFFNEVDFTGSLAVAASAPEPGTIALTFIGAGALLLGRGRRRMRSDR